MGNWRLDGCKDADGRLAREAMSSSSSGLAVSVSVPSVVVVSNSPVKRVDMALVSVPGPEPFLAVFALP